MKKITVLLILTALCADCCCAGSIWAKRRKDSKDVYSDDIARKPGDILTIKIREETLAETEVSREMTKSTERNQQYTGDVKIGNVLGDLPEFSLGAGTKHENDFTGTSDFTDDRTFEDSVTVVVTDILPNGNLVVSGTRSRSIAGDVQVIEVTGVVRPNDIGFDNTVDSERVADLEL